DGEEVGNVAIFANDVIDLTRGEHAVGGTTLGGSLLNGALSEIYFAPGLYLPDNSLFRTSGNRPTGDLSLDWPGGTAPLVYLRNPTASIGTNSGTGGDFTANGTITATDGP
ncbi:MAG TPA: hypothetical protein VFJ13_05775, partial [Paracoccaceae bacterium]|nr:hypothetical protein [Paracoccaceae bacterium]